MTTRSRRTTVVFHREFILKTIGRTLPAGEYGVTTDEEQIEYLSFPAFRRVSTALLVPTTPGGGSVEMYQVDPLHLSGALERDAQQLAAETATPPLTELRPLPKSAGFGPLSPEAAGLLAARYVKSGIVTLSSAVANARNMLLGSRTQGP